MWVKTPKSGPYVNALLRYIDFTNQMAAILKFPDFNALTLAKKFPTYFFALLGSS
jgi:hypothetical protein